MLDRLFQELSSDSLLPILRIHQHHTNPGKSILVTNRSRRSNDVHVIFHHKASLRTSGEEAVPIGEGLIPSRKRVQAEAGRYVLLGHYANPHRRKSLDNLNLWGEYLKETADKQFKYNRPSAVRH